MIILRYNNLISGNKYWYISVDYNCHWIIKVHSFIFNPNVNIPSSMWNCIIFDNEEDPHIFANHLQYFIDTYFAIK